MKTLSVIELSRDYGVVESDNTFNNTVYYYDNGVKINFPLTSKTESYFRTSEHNLEVFHFDEEVFKEKYVSLYLYAVEHNLIKTFRLENENYETATSYMKNKMRELMINQDFNINGLKLTMTGYNWNENYYALPNYEDSVDYAENEFREHSTPTVEYTANDAYIVFNNESRDFPLSENQLNQIRFEYSILLKCQLLLILDIDNTLPMIETIYLKSKDVNISATDAAVVLAQYKKLHRMYKIMTAPENELSNDELELRNWCQNIESDTVFDDMWAHKYMLAMYKAGIIADESSAYNDIIEIGQFSEDDASCIYNEYLDFINTIGYADTDYGDEDEIEEYEENEDEEDE
jgi:hypothetical protein